MLDSLFPLLMRSSVPSPSAARHSLDLGLNVQPGVHCLDGPSPFGALVDGFGGAVGFGYPGGMALHARAPWVTVTHVIRLKHYTCISLTTRYTMMETSAIP